MLKRSGMAALLLASATAANAANAATGDMSVATFLAKVDALKAKGPMALFSPDIGMLKNEAYAAGRAYRARLLQEKAAGKPSSCPPASTKVSQDMWLTHLQSYPLAQRAQISLHRAMADMFIKNFPCR